MRYWRRAPGFEVSRRAYAVADWDNNLFREHVTVHRSNKVEEATEIGSNNLLMAHSHVGHNVQFGNHVIMANGALLGGHVVVQDRAFISGNCLVHQFVRIGFLSMMQGGSSVSKDLPPFAVAIKSNVMCGLNIVGMRRGGIDSSQRLELKKLYRLLFRLGKGMRANLAAARQLPWSEPALKMLDFVTSSKRGVCSDAGWCEDSE